MTSALKARFISQMSDVIAARVLEAPDDPRKWDGWSKYQAANPYERLCLDARAKPTEEQIQQHCTALLQWWKKKLPLKHQPSNPLAQLLGRGLDEASRHLIQAQMDLLDPFRRREIDKELAAQARGEALAEFARYVAFSITNGVLTAEAEANLIEYGLRNELSEDKIAACIQEELRLSNAQRAPAPPVETTPAEQRKPEGDGESEFQRILELGEVTLWRATDSVREVLASVAQNLKIDSERAELLLDDFLMREEVPLAKLTVAVARPTIKVSAPAALPTAKPTPIVPASNFTNTIGAPMIFIPGGQFTMGSDSMDSSPNEQPLTPVKLSPFFMARHPVTNAQFEQFDPAHKQRRMARAGDEHPVVYVSSIDAGKYCQWLSQKDGRKYRLPTEAEWEFAARGTDGRRYPWGEQTGRGELANFADASTSFPWRDPWTNDGHPETSPVGAYPRGASVFGVEDMAGNVWEWCMDYFAPFPGVLKHNPRGATSGAKRVYRGGSWKSRFPNLRATARGSNAPSYSCNDLGFRVVCEA